MDAFTTLFGIPPAEVKEHCVIVPFLPNRLKDNLGIETLHQGKFFSAAQGDGFTLIKSGIGAPFVGDVTLYLKDTACRQVLLFGACGLTQAHSRMHIGSLVCPDQAANLESFSHTLSHTWTLMDYTYPDGTFLSKLMDLHQIPSGKCATVGSLKLEDDNINFLLKNSIDLVDMECSAFFNAARRVRIAAAALYFVTDIVKEKPYYRTLDEEDLDLIHQGLDAAADIIPQLSNSPSWV